MLLITVNYGVDCSRLEPFQHFQEVSSRDSLQKDLSEFMSIIPVDDIHNLTEFFYANDAAMRNSYNYLRDEGFARICQSLSTLTLVKKFTSFLNESGVNVAELGKRVEKIVLTKEEAAAIVGNC